MANSILMLGTARAWPIERCGNKAHNLYRLFHECKLKVPAGFVITSQRLHQVFYQAEQVLESGPNASASVMEHARHRILNVDLSDWDLIPEIEGALAAIDSEIGSHQVIVRSSSLSEDSSEATFAGVFESICVKAQLKLVLSAIAKVYASRLSGRAIAYASAIGKTRSSDVFLPMSVMVQRYISSSFGGVILTIDETNRSGEATIEIGLGGAEGVVSGETPALSLHFDQNKDFTHQNRNALKELLGSKESSERFQAVLMEVVRKTITLLGPSVEIEWLWDGRQIWVVQARPVRSTK